MQALADLLHDWHDFHLLVGTASATLVGLMFVAASIGSNVFNEKHAAAMKAFITPTVVHFTAVLVTCILVTIPTQSWTSLAGILGAIGLAGLTYSGRILVQVVVRHSFEVDLMDRLFYVLLPVVGYLFVVATAVTLFMHAPASTNVMAAALMLLLLAGIRNAWDMTVWLVTRPNSSEKPSP